MWLRCSSRSQFLAPGWKADTSRVPGTTRYFRARGTRVAGTSRRLWESTLEPAFQRLLRIQRGSLLQGLSCSDLTQLRQPRRGRTQAPHGQGVCFCVGLRGVAIGVFDGCGKEDWAEVFNDADIQPNNSHEQHPTENFECNGTKQRPKEPDNTPK